TLSIAIPRRGSRAVRQAAVTVPSLIYPMEEIVFRQRLAEKIALEALATHLYQQIALHARLDAFRDDAYLHVLANGNDALYQRAIGPCREVAHERTIDLELVEGQG